MQYLRIVVMLSFMIFLSGCGGNDYVKDIESSNPEVVSKAVFYVGKEKNRDAVPGLIKIVQGDMIDSVRISAVIALGRIGDVSAVDALIGLLKDEKSEMRAAACDALGRIGDARAVLPLINILEDKEVQMTALWALGKAGDSQAEPVLTELLKSGDKYIRFGAARALKEIGARK